MKNLKSINKSKIIKSFINIIGVFLFASLAFANNSKSTKQKPYHIIIPIHGLRGDETSYGAFAELIKKHLLDLDDEYEIVVPKVRYNIYNREFDQYQVASEINQQVWEQLDKLEIRPNGLKPQDKVSILLYSMGGNVGLPWLIETSKLNSDNSTGKKYKSLLTNLNFISLGAPFWGSLEAGNFSQFLDAVGFRSGIDIKSFVDEIITNKLLYKTATKFNMNQVEVLSASGKFIPKLRKDWIQFLTNSENQELIKKIYFTNIVGLIPCSNIISANPEANISELVNGLITGEVNIEYNNDCQGNVSNETKKISSLLNTFLSGSYGPEGRRESDMVVPAPSATLDFFFNKADGTFKRVNSLIPKPEVQDVHYAGKPHLVTRHVQVSHATLDAEKWDDYVVIKKELCGDENVYSPDCNRFYKYLLFYLTSPNKRGTPQMSKLFKIGDHKDKVYTEQRDVQRDDDARARQLQTFMLDFNLIVDAQTDLSELERQLTYGSIFQQIQIPLLGSKEKISPCTEINLECFTKVQKAAERIIEGANKMAQNIDQPEQDHVVNYTNADELPYIVQIGRSVQVGSRIIRVLEVDGKKEIHITLMGRVVPKYLLPQYAGLINTTNMKNQFNREFVKTIQNGIELPDFTIEIPGTTPKVVKKALIQPGYSTFIELNLN